MLELSKRSAILAGMVTEIEKGEKEPQSLRQPILDAFEACYSIINFYNINLHKAFDKMIFESEAFVEKNKLT